MAADPIGILSRERKTAFKIETNTGQKATLAAADAGIRFFDSGIKFDFETTDRPTDSAAPQGTRIGARPGTFTGGTELWGGSTLPKVLDLLRCCGWDDTGYTGATAKLFKPVIGQNKTLTLGVYRPGFTRYLTGAMGTAVLNLKAGEVARADWTFNGVAEQVDAAALTGITYDNTPPLAVGAVTFSVGTGSALVVPEVEIDLGNTLFARRDIKAKDSANRPTGIRAYRITAFNPLIKMSPEALALTDRDWFTAHQDYTDIACSIVLGSGSNALAINAGALRINKSPEDVDDNGQLRHSLELAATGTDCLTFDFSALV